MNAPIPSPTPTDTRDPDEKLSDARAALACLEDVLCHTSAEQRGLGLLNPHNLAGFLRLVLAQFPKQQ